MTQRVTIKVEQKHIDAGGEEDEKCPVRHAMVEMGIHPLPFVYEDEVIFGDGWTGRSACPVARLPERAREFIRKNDANEPREPFEFELDLPDGVTLTPQGTSAEST